MDTKARDAYLEAQVLTATPQKLRLMLIDAALKYARLNQVALREQEVEKAFDSGNRLRGIVAELLGSVSRNGSDLNKRTAALYLFLFQKLSEAQLSHEPDLLTDVISILEMEQATWRQVCEKFPHTIEAEELASKEILASSMPPITFPTAPGALLPSQPSGFSLDA